MRFRFLMLAALAQAAAAQTSTTCNNTPTYSPCELVFELSDAAAAANPNPYRTVELRAEMRSPRHRTIELPAYWDGGRRMAIRFAPTEAGQWDFHLISNVADLNDKTGSVTAVESDAAGFVVKANVHHWSYTEHQKGQPDLLRPHLWMGSSAPRFAFLDDAAFRALADARAAQKFNHVAGWITGDGADAAYTAPDAPKIEFFHRLDERVRYLNEKGITADLVLAGGEGTLTKLFPQAADRRRFVRYAVARYAAMNVTWQAVDAFEDYPDARALMKEIGGALKDFDGYKHPRTMGAHITSSPFLDDGWMDFTAYGNTDDNVGAIEHQLYPVPLVNQAVGGSDAAALRKHLWNATMDGQYPTMATAAPDDVKAMSVWFDILSSTRHWELEPYFDVDGGRALALEDTEYLVYIEKPSALELRVEKHGYDALWINPADGATVRKKFSGDHFTAAPPDNSHDWVLHLVREGTLQSMNRSYKFESRDIVMQEIEANPEKTPYDIDQPAEDLSLSKTAPFHIKLKRETRATRSMLYLWTGEVTADHQGARILATGAQGTFQPTKRLAVNYPALLLMRVYGMNANGKVYLVTKAAQLNQ